MNNTDKIIDSRDVIDRITELQDELTNTYGESGSEITFEDWLSKMEDDEGSYFQDTAAELLSLLALQSEAEDVSDWEHGADLIREDHFQAYAQELAGDCCEMPKELSWPFTCIDWEWAANELKHDYTSVEFSGVTYYVRA